MNKQQITELINSKIIDNDNGQITAEVMRNVLNAINEGTGDGYTYISTATPSTTPITLTGDEKVFYIATEEGDYANFGLGNISSLSVIKSDNGSWKVEIINKSSDLELQYSDNLLIAKDMTVVGNLSNTDGTLQTSFTGWSTSEHFISCKPNIALKRLRKDTSVQSKMVVYDANFRFIKSFYGDNADNFTTPSNAAYAKFSAYTSGVSRVAYYLASSELAEVIEGDYPEIVSKTGIPIKKDYYDKSFIDTLSANLQEELSKTLQLKYSGNLLIAKDIIVGGNLSNTDGTLLPSMAQYGWLTSEHFISCKPNTAYKRVKKANNQSKMVVYDANFNFIESFPDIDEFTTPPNACYAKFSAVTPGAIAYYLATSELTEVVEGDYPTIESKSGIPIKGSSLTESDKNIWDKKTIFLTGSSTVARGKFQQIISDKTGADIITNGLPGRTVHYFAFHSSGSSGEFDRLITAEDLAGVDVIVICGYTNNLWSSLGSMDDDYVTITQAEAESYTDISSYASSIFGAYIPSLRSVVEYYLSIAPQVPIIISGQLPVSRPQEAWNGQTNNVDFKRVYNGSGKTAEDFSNATKEVAEYYSLPFVDMHHNGQINIINYATYYDGNDTSHPNFKNYDSTIGDYPISGMKIMAMGIIESLKKII
jgi:hypothetical protein